MRRLRLSLVVGLAACTLAPRTADPSSAGAGSETPEGFGTLRQEDVSISLVSGDLRVMVTPLATSVTHVTAPDTQRRLVALAETHRRVPGGTDETLFLVSFYSERPDVRFAPEEIEIVAQGMRVQPTLVTAITPTWGERRVGQRQTESAVYHFPASVDLESDLVLVYGLMESRNWSSTLSRIQAERARVRVRAETSGTS